MASGLIMGYSAGILSAFEVRGKGQDVHFCFAELQKRRAEPDTRSIQGNWKAISTNYVPEGVLDFRDPDADEHPTRFYRAVLLP
jgi:hypothetical protein